MVQVEGGGGDVGNDGDPGGGGGPPLEEERLLSVLTHGSTGRNPTFFKAAGHEGVFGLKADIPVGGQVILFGEVVAKEGGGQVGWPQSGIEKET